MNSLVSGFTIVRNAELLHYPFPQCILSILPICDEFIINCGDSSDNTAEQCHKLEQEYPSKIKVIYSHWDITNQSGGLQLKVQSDAALSQCRYPWCFYIQADEIVHETDLEKIQQGIVLADARGGVDGILFDYLHFYGSFSYTIKGRNWYRREVRAFKNYRGIHSFRDAQGFRKNGERLKVLPSGARIFHYGYVRSVESMAQKSHEMAHWWGTKASIELKDLLPVRHLGLEKFPGNHPAILGDYIKKFQTDFNPRLCRRKWDKNEIKNAITLLWENLFRWRIGEFRNYEVVQAYPEPKRCFLNGIATVELIIASTISLCPTLGSDVKFFIAPG